MKQTTYEFVVRVKHPLPDRAEYQINVMRTLVGRTASMLHDAKFHNGTLQITPIVKKRSVKKRSVSNNADPSPSLPAPRNTVNDKPKGKYYDTHD